MGEEGKGLEGYDGGGAEEFAACVFLFHLIVGCGVFVEDAVDWVGLGFVTSDYVYFCEGGSIRTVYFEHPF